ncbi:hypothetical protein MY3296_004708 [Beauveria thailandica]
MSCTPGEMDLDGGELARSRQTDVRIDQLTAKQPRTRNYV